MNSVPEALATGIPIFSSLATQALDDDGFGPRICLMSNRLPFFEALQGGFLYRVFVAGTDLVCVRLGQREYRGRSDRLKAGAALGSVFVAILGVGAFIAGRMAGAEFARSIRGQAGLGAGLLITMLALNLVIMIVAKISQAGETHNVIDEVGRYERGVEEELIQLAKFDAADLYTYVREKKRGYTISCKKVEEAKIDYVGKWRRFVFGTPDPALIITHPAKGTMKLVFRKRSDVAIGIYEMEQLLGDRLEIAIHADDYEKSIKKYAKTRRS